MTPDDFAPKPRLRAVEGHGELAQQVAAEAARQAQPTDVQYVAIGIDHLRHLDLRAVATGMFGEAMPKDVNEAIEKMAEWAAANRGNA